MGPDCGKEDAKDGDVGVDGDDNEPVEEIRVVEDDGDLSDVEDDGEDEVGDEYVEEREETLAP